MVSGGARSGPDRGRGQATNGGDPRGEHPPAAVVKHPLDGQKSEAFCADHQGDRDEGLVSMFCDDGVRGPFCLWEVKDD